MTLPKKGHRKISVDHKGYAWSVKGTDGGLHLSVVPIAAQHNLLSALFDYHSKPVGQTITADGTVITHMEQQLLITGYIVRQVILYALNGGWDPEGERSILHLRGIADKLDLRLDKEAK